MSTSEQKPIDYLTEDPVIHGQEWICLSFLSVDGNKSRVKGVKFRGAFGTEEEARAHAKKISQEIDPSFNIFVGQGFKWLPFDPEPDSDLVKEQEYREKELNDLMKAYMAEQERRRRDEADRKRELMMQSATKSETREEKARKRLQKKLEQRKAEEEKKPGDSKEIEKKLDETVQTVEKEKEEIKKIDDNIDKFKKILEKIKEKKN